MKKIKIKIGELFDYLEFSPDNKKEQVFRNKKNIKIKNHLNKFVPIYEYIIKKEDSYKCIFENGIEHICSDEHILLTETGEKKVRDITFSDRIEIINDDGIINFTRLISKDMYKNEDTLYDFSLGFPHLFKTTNGLIHHNSLSIYALSRFLRVMNKKILLIVPNIGLVEQMYSDFADYGWQGQSREVQKLYSRYSNEFDKNIVKPVLISTWQSLITKPPSFFKEFDAVIVDEVHLAKCMSIQKIMKASSKAEYRIGFTGTLPDEKADLYTIIGYIGPCLYSIASGELIDRGILSKIMIANLICKYPLRCIKECHGRGYNFEIDYTMSYTPRNDVLTTIFSNTPPNQNTLILVSRVDKHLKPLTALLEAQYPDKEIYIIYGSTPALEREKIRALMERKTGLIIIATYQTLSTGFNVKNLHQIVFFSSYKAKIKVIQSIGRGLRVHESKDLLIVYDVVDDLTYKTRNGTVYHNYQVDHFFERRKYYLRQGFRHVNKIINLKDINTIN